MKKLTTLLVAMLFTAGMAFAQSNDYTLEQTGNDNDADAVQTGLENEAYIQQGNFGGGNIQSNNAEAIISQVGSFNDATIKQRQGFASGTFVSLHTIDQEGQLNEALFVAFNGGNNGTIEQLGIENYARGQQSALGGLVNITQTGDENSADADQLNSSDAIANIVQEGTFNEANTNQKGGDNEVEVGQFGVDNDASSFQQGAGNYGDIYQSGVNHSGSQWVSGDDNSVEQTQTGSNNSQRMEITGSGSSFNATQNGQDNKAYVNARGTGPGDNTLQLFNSEIMLLQEGSNLLTSGSVGGDNNTINIHQAGTGHTIDAGSGFWSAEGFTVEGNNNTVGINQYGTSHNTVVTVLGNGNTSSTLQTD